MKTKNVITNYRRKSKTKPSPFPWSEKSWRENPLFLTKQIIFCLFIFGYVSFLSSAPSLANEQDRLAPSPQSPSGDSIGSDEDTLALSIGRSIEWPIPSRVQISVSNGAAIKVTDLNSRIRITAKKLGVSTIRAGNKVLHVSVVPEGKYRLFLSLQEAITGKRGLRLSIDGNQISVRGHLLRWTDWIELATAVDGTPENYEFIATIDPSLRIQATQYFRTLLRQSRLPDLAFDLQPSPAIALPTEPADLQARVERVFLPYGFRIEKSSSTLSLEPLVRVKILVTELNKLNSNQLGLDWKMPIEGQLLPSPQLAAGNVLPVTLHAIESQGLGKVLASPTLLCRSGKEAQFLAGGEFPIKVGTKKTYDVQWKRHGILLRVRPLADYSGRMSIAIETEVSMIDSSQTVDGVPGLLTNRIETHFDLSSGRTIALSGLIKKEWGESQSGLFGLINIPIIGALFGSKQFREHRTELVVFVTPEITRPDQEGL